MRYELSLEYYQGPLDKLLQLIEEKKLEVTRLSLLQVTTDFLAYVEKVKASEEKGEVSSQMLADFLVIASRLLLLKTKALLPSLQLTQEEEGEILDLETRLKIYQEIKAAQVHVKDVWRDAPQIFSREFLMNREVVFYPPKGVDAEALHASLIGIVGELEKIFKPVATIKREIINLKMKIETVLKRLTETPIKFQDLRDGRSRQELVVLFLAVLHLIKQQSIDVEQDGHFSEMIIAKRQQLN